jgi:tetratricopeptide (TPR) repeat protein
MPDKQGFSATDFIRKQYKKTGSSGPETNRVEPEQTVPSTEQKPEGDNHKDQDFLSSEAVKTFIKQNMTTAEDHVKSGRTWEAIGLYKACLQLSPQNTIIQQKLTDAYIKVNAREESIDALSKLAGLYEREGKMEQANETYEKIYSLDPKNDLACSVLGRKPESGIPYPDLPFSHTEQDKSIEIERVEPIIPTKPMTGSPLDELMKMDAMRQEDLLKDEKPSPSPENKIIDSEPPPVKEEFPFPPPPIKDKAKTVSQDDIPTVVPTSKPKPVDTEGPKPVEELMPLDSIPVKKEIKQPLMDQKPGGSVLPKKPVDLSGPSAVEELIPLPPMPEKRNIPQPPSPVKHEPVKEKIVEPVTESKPESTPIKEEFPLPLTSVQEEQSVLPVPETLKQRPETRDQRPETVQVPESPNERVQYYLDMMAMDPDNTETRLNYINAYLEIGLEQELVDDYLELANCFRIQGNNEEASKYYQKVLTIDPSIIEAKQKLDLLKSEDQSTQSKPSPETVVQVKEGKPSVETQAQLSGSDTTHINQFKRMLQINPLNDQATRKLANFYRSKDMHKEAVYELTMLADAYMQRGMYSKAEPIYEEIIREAPSEELKQKLSKSKSLKKSMDAINQAIKSYKTDLNVVTKKKT